MSLRAAASEIETGRVELPPQVIGVPTNGGAAAGEVASPAPEAVVPAGWDLDFSGLWENGWDELVNEDAEQIGEAYEAGILGGVLGIEDEATEPESADLGFKESSGHRTAGAQKDKKKMSAKGLISNFVLSIIGSTTLGLAEQMKVGGWLLPPLMVIAGAFIVAENTRLVTATIDKMQAEGRITVLAYPDFAKGAFGIWGKRLASVTSMCALLGMMCTTLVLESQNFNFVLPITWPWFGCTRCGRKWWCLFLMPVTVLYVFGNPGALMKRTAFLGPVVCILTVILAWAGAGASIAGEVGSYGFYSFAVIVTVPTLRSQMKDPKKTAPAAILAYAIALVLFLPIMFLGYAGFGNSVPENLIDGMRQDRPAGWWALNRPWEMGEITVTGICLDFVVTVNLLLTEAIYIPCTVLAIEASFPGLFRHGPAWARKAMRVAFILFRFLVATEVQSFVAISSLVSSLFCVCNNIVFPIVAFHWYKVKEVSLSRKCVHAIILLYGSFILVLGTYSSIAALSPREELEPGAFLREGISTECVAEFHRANHSDSA